MIEAALKSGSLITARLAAEQGREVFAIPGSIHNPLTQGCHSLIQQGAKLTGQLADILDELSHLPISNAQPVADKPGAPPYMPENDPPIDHPLLESIGFEPTSIDALVDHSGLTAEVVSSMLLTLELQGIVASSGGLFSRNR